MSFYWGIVSLFLSACVSELGRASEEGMPPIETFIDYEEVEYAELSPDNRWAVAVVRVVNPQWVADGKTIFTTDAFNTRISVIDLRTGLSEPIGPFEESTSNPSWSPDGKFLVFQVGINDHARFWVWSAEERTARLVSGTAVPRQLGSKAQWTSDGCCIVTVLLSQDTTVEVIRARLGYSKGDQDFPLDRTVRGARVAVYPSAGSNEVLRSSDDAELITHAGDLALIEIGSGRVKRIAVGYRPSSFSVSPDGLNISFVHFNRTEARNNWRNVFDVFAISTGGGGEPQRLATEIFQLGAGMELAWSPDGRLLAFHDSAWNREANKYYVADVSTGKVRVVAEALHASSLPVWESSGSSFYVRSGAALHAIHVASGAVSKVSLPSNKQVLRTFNDLSECSGEACRALLVQARDSNTRVEGFFTLDIGSGKLRKLIERDASFGHVSISHDRTRVLYLEERADSPPQLWLSSTKFRYARQISEFNHQIRKFRMGKAKLIEISGCGGEKLFAAIHFPADYSSNRKYPTLIRVYGGAGLSQTITKFSANRQLLQSRGYLVVDLDTHVGSATPMRDIANSVRLAVARLTQEPYVDPDRLGIAGHSYGGYSVLSVLVDMSRFKASVVSAGISNLTGVYGGMKPSGVNLMASWAEDGQGRMGTTIWDARERFIENSPFFYFDRITTPVLLIHGTNDELVWSHQSDEIYHALRRLGKVVQYAKYLDEPHNLMGRPSLIDVSSRTIAWLDKYLK